MLKLLWVLLTLGGIVALTGAASLLIGWAISCSAASPAFLRSLVGVPPPLAIDPVAGHVEALPHSSTQAHNLMTASNCENGDSGSGCNTGV